PNPYLHSFPTRRSSDLQLDSNVATVTITVVPVNTAPAAANDSYTVVGNSTLTVPAPGVLANDTDIDNDRLTAILVSNPSNGTLRSEEHTSELQSRSDLV